MQYWLRKTGKKITFVQHIQRKRFCNIGKTICEFTPTQYIYLSGKTQKFVNKMPGHFDKAVALMKETKCLLVFII